MPDQDSKYKKILIYQTAFLGDVVLSTAIIASLRAEYPNAEIYIVTVPAAKDLLIDHPDIQGMIFYQKKRDYYGVRFFQLIKQLRKLKFDLVVSPHKSFRTALILFLSGIPKRLGFKNTKGSFLYTDTAEYLKEQHAVVRNASILDGVVEKVSCELSVFSAQDVSALTSKHQINKKYVIIAPGSVWETKRWPAASYQKLINYLDEDPSFVDYSFVITGSAAEQDLCNRISGSRVINLAGKLSIAELKALVKSASLQICNDSMILHLASAFKTPVVAVFCSTVPEFGFGPYQNPCSQVVQVEGLECKPCGSHGHMRCPLKTDACRLDLSPKVVYDACQKLLTEINNGSAQVSV